MRTSPTFEFHVSRAARDQYQFADELFSLSGNVVFANLAASRIFADKMNRKRDLERHPRLAVRLQRAIDERQMQVAGRGRPVEARHDVGGPGLDRILEGKQGGQVTGVEPHHLD